MAMKAYHRLYVSFSGGKDSLSLAGIIEEIVQEGGVDPSKIEFVFIDEEAVYPDVIPIVEKWRKRVMMWGGKFHWLCLPVKHFNCFNQLENDMTFICWDPRKRDVWVRPMPEYAIKSHPKLKWGMTYQEFLEKVTDGINLIGLRAPESFQRVQMFEAKPKHKLKLYPIYDWHDWDVWRYLADRGIEFPQTYVHMFRAGVPRKDMRLSQFFSIDTAKSLVRMMEFYPDLYERILRREPNAYLAMYYWDSEMFRRNSKERKELEGERNIDYRAEVMARMPELREKDPMSYRRCKSAILHYESLFTEETWKILHMIIVAGDPKARTYRRIHTTFREGGDATFGRKE